MTPEILINLFLLFKHMNNHVLKYAFLLTYLHSWLRRELMGTLKFGI
jgi:hypothetical protein